MLKNYNYILTILLYPFILVLTYFKFTNFIKGDLYTYLILIMLIIFIPSFIMSLYGIAEDILKSNKKWRIIFLILLSKEEKYLGYLLFIISIPLTGLAINATNERLLKTFNYLYRSYVVINEQYVYYSSNNLFSINVDKSFRCSRDDIGDYVISCDRLDDDSFIGIYSYDASLDDEEELEEKLNFHLEQTIDYILENGYTYEITNDSNIIEIDYNENTILLTESNYMVGEAKYCLIIIKEMPKEYISYEEYQKMIDSIYFLNYNEEVSS